VVAQAALRAEMGAACSDRQARAARRREVARASLSGAHRCEAFRNRHR
jgi:hypothetical protein